MILFVPELGAVKPSMAVDAFLSKLRTVSPAHTSKNMITIGLLVTPHTMSVKEEVHYNSST